MNKKIDLYLSEEVLSALEDAEKRGTKRRQIVEQAIALLAQEPPLRHTSIMVSEEAASKFKGLRAKNRRLNNEILRILKDG